MSKITKDIYLSNLSYAQEYNQEYESVISIIDSNEDNIGFTHKNHLKLIFKDDDLSNLQNPIDKAYEFITHRSLLKKADDVKVNEVKKKLILVHCRAGVSRSPSIVIGYLMKKYNYSFLLSYIMVVKARSIINPNKSFFKQLSMLSGNDHGFCRTCYLEMNSIELKNHNCDYTREHYFKLLKII